MRNDQFSQTIAYLKSWLSCCAAYNIHYDSLNCMSRIKWLNCNRMTKQQPGLSYDGPGYSLSPTTQHQSCVITFTTDFSQSPIHLISNDRMSLPGTQTRPTSHRAQYYRVRLAAAVRVFRSESFPAQVSSQGSFNWRFQGPRPEHIACKPDALLLSNDLFPWNKGFFLKPDGRLHTVWTTKTQC